MAEQGLVLLRTLRWMPGLVAAVPRARFSAADLLERRARRSGERCFVRFEGRDWSYA